MQLYNRFLKPQISNVFSLGAFHFLLVSILILSFSPRVSFSQGCWTQVASMPQSRYNAVSFSINDIGYVLTGQASGGTWRSEFFKYDPISNSWTQLPNFPGAARTGAVSFSINGKGYIGTGRDDNGNTRDFWEYDPLTIQWTQKANYPPGIFEAATGFSIGNYGYVFGGLSWATSQTDFYQYDPLTDTWTQKADFPLATGRYESVGFSIGNKGYVGTGYYSGFNGTSDFWEYNPATNTWLQLANVPGPLRAGSVGFSVSGKGYLGIGNQYSDFYSYDVANNTWSQTTDYGPGHRDDATCFVLNDIAYVGSGYYLATKSDWWKFDPASYDYLTPVTACGSLLFQGNTYTSSTNVLTTVSGVTPNGCDSVYVQPIIIFNTVVGTDTQIACNSYTWMDGNTYIASNNSATFNIVGGSVNGCDSIVTLDLTIINSAIGTDSRTECNSFTWIDGNTYSTNNNTATFNIVGGATNGCDSLVTLDLTIINSAIGTDTRTECNSFAWIDGNTYSASNNTTTFNILGGATNGCDSLVTLDLTIINSSTGTDTRTECNSFTWIDGNTYTTNNNTATFNIIGGANNGCDSLVTLDLIIVNSTSGTDTRTACNIFTWIDGNTYTTNNTTATHTLLNSTGCDSVVTLNLSIQTVNVGVTNTSPTLTANATGSAYQWLDCENNFAVISGANMQVFTATFNGNYAVEVTENGCIDTSVCVSVNNVGILENSFGKEFTVYPNPTKDMVTIDLGKKHNEVTLKVLNQLGQEVLKMLFEDSSLLQFNIQGEAGLYFIEVSTEDKKAIVKVVKE